MPRPDRPANRPRQALLLQPSILAGVGVTPGRLRFGLLIRKGSRQYRLRRAEVTVNMRRREREQRADAIEPMPPWILVERAGHAHIEVDAEQIVDSVTIFLAAEPVMSNRPPPCHPRRFPFRDPRRKPVNRSFKFLRRRLRLFLRRHLAGVHAEDDFAPPLSDILIGEVERQCVEPKFSFLLLRVVTAQAVGMKERLD